MQYVCRKVFPLPSDAVAALILQTLDLSTSILSSSLFSRQHIL